ncbi:OprO/OprP family phosphate-selective porin [Calycomorphotria hydatis]|uniref:Porin P n=1 Tax=Calycomorphotria hydatis TaxID=2528027 RepID=A0A517TCU7_9PLAN|nr:porin [Calycomorphotria hydatis]QDT66191.1 Porin P precursor [Calycomorphotria hydatis]
MVDFDCDVRDAVLGLRNSRGRGALLTVFAIAWNLTFLVAIDECCAESVVTASVTDDLPTAANADNRSHQLAGYQTEYPPVPPAPGMTAEQELEELRSRLSAIETSWSEYQDDLKKKKEKAASKPTFQINGRIHMDYWTFPETDGGIGFFEHPSPLDPRFGTDPEDFLALRRLRLEMKGDILESGYWRFQIDFNNPTLPEIKDVFVGFKGLPMNQRLQIGNQKRPLGLDHLNSSRYNVFLERPLVVEAFNEDARRPGIAFYGNTCDESLGWTYGGFLMENVSRDGRYRGDSYQGSLNGRLFSSPWYEHDGRDYYHCAISGMLAYPDGNASALTTNFNEGRFRTRPEGRSESRWFNTGRVAGARSYSVLGLESMYNVGPLQVTGEYEASWWDRSGGAVQPDLFFHGGYVFVAYNLTGEHIPYSRKSGTIGRLIPHENFFLFDNCCGRKSTGWGAWQVGLRYDYIDLTDGDITGGSGHSGTLAVNWFFTAYSKLQFNLVYGTIDNRGPIGGFSEGNYLIAGTRLAIEF